ncbi:MAG: nucleotidyltransferase family protein [Rhodoferax sp.]|nr:nucleotidyltransferase family protein [Rhodoferax sp.]
MLLAAGRGERMRPLTDRTPKPLLEVQGKALMQWHLRALAQGGVQSVAINTAWLGEHIETAFGTDTEGLALHYSHEGRDFGGALETAGAIARALPLLGPVFWVVAGDVYAPDFVFSGDALNRFSTSDKLAHLWLVPNPEHNPGGDFGLQSTQGQNAALALNLARDSAEPLWTYSTIGLYRRELFVPPWCAIEPGNPHGTKASLAPLLRAAMDQQRVSAELYTGRWTDVGTPQRLALLNATSSS